MSQSITGYAAPERRRLTLPTISWRAFALPHRLALIGITLIAIFCNFWSLGQNGYGNLYYAATVKSMGENWHAFFFASFDPAGFVTVDKPPVGFWLQVLSTKLFGYTPFAIFLPQALAGVLSVVLVYWLVRRHFGRVAGLIAATALALSPISVVTNRNNTIDSTLLLVLLLAAWAAFRAIETDRLRWLVVSGLLIAVGFNIKMMEAYLIVPAFALTFLLSSRKPWLRRIADLLISGVTMLGLSFLWVIIVDLVPAGLRPWVGSTSTNSELSLALGYNGIQRLFGMGSGSGGAGGPGGARPSGAGGPPAGGPPSGAGFPGGSGVGRPPGGPGGPGGAGGAGGATGQVGLFNTGNPGALRLFTQPLGGQIVWLLPLALIGVFVLAVARRFRPREDQQQQSLILWGGWLLTMTVFFSVASFFHQYYLSQMAPAIAAMAGIAIVTMWDQYRQPGWRGWLLPLALVVTAAEQVYIIASDPTWGTWLIPVIVIPTALAAIVLVALRLRPDLVDNLRERMAPTTHDLMRRVGVAAVTVGLLALLATPTVWSLYPALTNTVSDLPTAGATTLVGNAAPSSQVDSQLVAYLEAHQGSATYLVATSSSNTADAIIITTGKAVMALGGFTGTDPILTTAQLQSLIKQGEVRYFLLSGSDAGGNNAATVESGASGEVINVGGPNGNQSSAATWVRANCTVVSASAYGSSGSAASSLQLYDCAG